MSASKIEWTDATWNPVRGCSRVSAGCERCYAERQASRFTGAGMPYEGLATIGKNGPRWTGKIKLVPEHLADPLRWKRPRRIFVNSMSDLFHDGVPDEYIGVVFAVMAMAPQHTFQVLTKRPERMLRWIADGAQPTDDGLAALATTGKLGDHWRRGPFPTLTNWPLPNVWLGVSVENQATADERIPLLLQTPAAVRFLSCEPLLGRVDLRPFMPWVFRNGIAANADGSPFALPAVGGSRGVDWVIVGGESGPGARPYDLAWPRSIVAQCAASRVPVFHKQLGAAPVFTAGDAQNLHAEETGKLRSRKGNNPDEWPDDLRVRQFPAVP